MAVKNKELLLFSFYVSSPRLCKKNWRFCLFFEGLVLHKKTELIYHSGIFLGSPGWCQPHELQNADMQFAMSQIPNQAFATKLFFFQPVKAICSTPQKNPWFPRRCSIVRIPYGQSRSHWNSHSWVSCSESADCDLVSRHISPLFLTHCPTTSETYIIAFPDLIPFVCLRSVSLPSLKTCSHSTDLP